MSFTDITVFREAESALRDANERLEERVVERTHELEQLNQRLVLATRKSESESQSKMRFLAAVSHDLMQPLNAARLFASSLSEASKDDETRKLSGHIESALGAAEELIGDLLDISRLESGKLQTNVRGFQLSEVFNNLKAEFSAISKGQNIDFSVVSSSLIVKSDPKLLRRVLQNFLTNAFRYNPEGKVLLGARRINGRVRIDVWMMGSGFQKISRKRSSMSLPVSTKLERIGGWGWGSPFLEALREYSIIKSLCVRGRIAAACSP
ncbi:sensor histidine kinase [Vibrio maritimus]|uniref:histidine kinase n=1 Tax=Vibrio maritimus TaxID=990268 RepID=A0A090S6P8_9VIBR|nr:sensor histidine kinase [Vibrio maritimus]